MKITIYELLGLVKDGKAPKAIRYNGNIYYSSEDRVDLHAYQTERTVSERKLSLIIDNEYLNLYDEVEIIEEDNKIEHCKDYEGFLGIDDYVKYLKIKLDELIDKINDLKEGKE